MAKRTISKNRILSIIKSVCRAALLIGMGYIIMYPILYMFSMGFRDVTDLYDQTVRWIPKNFTLDNFKRIMEGMDYWNTLTNTLFTSVLSTVLLMPACMMIAYSLARFKFKGQGIIFSAVLLTIVVPMEFFTLAQFLNLNNFDAFGILKLFDLISGKSTGINLINTHWSFFLPAVFGIGIRSGLYIFILRQSLKGLPKELEEAAYIDGCGFIKTFISVIIPSATSAIVTIMLFSFVWHWNDYQLSSIFIPEHPTLSSSLKNLSNLLYGSVDLGVTSIDPKQSVLDSQVGSLLVVIPVLLIYLCAQKFFTNSIERTGLVE